MTGREDSWSEKLSTLTAGRLNRIHITGAAGNGKTTLAHRLSLSMQIPCYELDLIMYRDGSGEKYHLETRLNELAKIIARPVWITEGAYLWWVSDLFRAADLIIWLDLPWYLAIGRILMRHFTESLAGRNRHPGLIKLLRFVARYQSYYLDATPDQPCGLDDDRAGNHKATELFLSEFQAKLFRCRSSRDVANIFELIRNARD